MFCIKYNYCASNVMINKYRQKKVELITPKTLIWIRTDKIKSKLRCVMQSALLFGSVKNAHAISVTCG